MPVRPAIIASLVYDDAPRAIDFLCAAFGFERLMVVDDEEPGKVAHAQLSLSGNIVMLNSVKPAMRERFKLVAPGEAGGLVSLALYVVLDDPDAHHARATTAGAEIVTSPHDKPYGGRGYDARDPEGHLWSFGDYDPWA